MQEPREEVTTQAVGREPAPPCLARPGGKGSRFSLHETFSSLLSAGQSLASAQCLDKEQPSVPRPLSQDPGPGTQQQQAQCSFFSLCAPTMA